ncbi:MAG: hypothetical protein KC478_10900, partial [Bacteriovoracaceae bacterium]|nr:hypothetical protein [Bacteriovoracaceae bacterium]
KISFDVLSRKLKNLGEIDEHINKVNGSALIINSCAREYQMSFNSTKSLEIWDLNYSMDNHKLFAQERGITYTDGHDLLIRQAQYALSFWNS